MRERSPLSTRAGSANPAAGCPETIPNLEAELHRLTMPSIQKTPVGASPRGVIDGYIRRLRSGRLRPWRAIIDVMLFRKSRGEPVEQIAAPLYLAAAALVSVDVDTSSELAVTERLVELSDVDDDRENDSRRALKRFIAEPTEANRLAWAECEAMERNISDRICALALVVAGTRR